ncbi:MAG: carbonic anhydrase family protein, partial [Candidatus Kapabacteria bacterium]|jgi:carbonic anhydrase|nr:carbonic anhydrase family protein [Candidatus Kapabacteria bacterium]
LPDLEFNYSTTSTQIENDGHAIKFICDGGSSLKIGEMNYQLLELHYHSASEHQIEGQNYPLEVHFVHKASETDLAVVGIIFEEGAENELFSRFLSNFPLEKGSYSDKSMINLIELIPENKSYYHYEGSLTTPPCSETVSWYVLKERLTASAEQITQFSAILKNNYRYVQNLYGRVIYGKGS